MGGLMVLRNHHVGEMDVGEKGHKNWKPAHPIKPTADHTAVHWSRGRLSGEDRRRRVHQKIVSN